MAGKQKKMKEIREIIVLLSQGYGTKRVSSILKCSRNTVKKYKRIIDEQGLDYSSLLKCEEPELEKYFLKEEVSNSERFKELAKLFPGINSSLEDTGVNLFYLWSEYKASNPDGYSYSMYCKYYREYCEKTNPDFHVDHIPGDKLFIDYTGRKLEIVDRETGEVSICEVYICVLGRSQLTYVEASLTQKQEDFALCTSRALHYYGGVPQVLVPDNLKSGVTQADKYEPSINPLFSKLAAHYNTEVLPTRSRKPKDKSLVENHVKTIYTRIFAPIRNCTFFSLEELNKEIRRLLEIHNNTKFQGRDYSRRDIFESEEKSALLSLPEFPFEISTHKTVTAMKNCYVQLMEDNHYYSIPYRYIGKKVTLSYTSREVQVFYRGERIAYHRRDRSKYKYTSISEHLPSTHRFVAEWNSDKFINMASSISPHVQMYIELILSQSNYPEVLYRTCMGILQIERKVGRERLIDACKAGLYIKTYSYAFIKNILKNKAEKLYQQELNDKHTKPLPEHENIRGAEYYKLQNNQLNESNNITNNE